MLAFEQGFCWVAEDVLCSVAIEGTGCWHEGFRK